MGSNCPAVLQFKWYDFGRLGSTIREAKKKKEMCVHKDIVSLLSVRSLLSQIYF